MSGDTLTIVRSNSLRLAKRIHADGQIEGYAKARIFDLFAEPVADLTALAALLRRVTPWCGVAVVRGAILDPNRACGVRRLLYPDHGTGEDATLRDVPRRWLALDMEGIDLPPGTPAADLAACARLALARLPAVFSDAACIVQASGSHGFRPDLRLRLWSWCDRPVTGMDLKRWLRDTPADPCVFGAAQLIYTARPVLAPGMRDPVPDRLALLPGAAEVVTPPPGALAPPRRVTPPRPLHPAHTGRYARAALVRASDRIMHSEKRHPTIISECRGLARLVAAGLLPVSDLHAVVMAAARAAGKDDEEEISKCIAWGLAHPGDGLVPEVNRHGR